MKKILVKQKNNLSGECSGLIGDCTGLSGDLDQAELTAEERKRVVDISDLIREQP